MKTIQDLFKKKKSTTFQQRRIEHNKIIFNNSKYKCIYCKEKISKPFLCKRCYDFLEGSKLQIEFASPRKIKVVKICDKYEVDKNLVTKKGECVRSEAELKVANCLFDAGIEYIYEYRFPINDKLEKDLRPDFYLPEKDIWLEYWSSEGNPKYLARVMYKLMYYAELKQTVIGIYNTDLDDTDFILDKIYNCQKGKLNQCMRIYKQIGKESLEVNKRIVKKDYIDDFKNFKLNW